jgi:AcrR family transcriptional regulator
VGGGQRPGTASREHAGDTRALLDAAMEAFARHGYAGASVRAIARTAGLNDGGLYTQFRSKQDLYQALLRGAGPGRPSPAAIAPPATRPPASATWSSRQ